MKTWNPRANGTCDEMGEEFPSCVKCVILAESNETHEPDEDSQSILMFDLFHDVTREGAQ